MTTRLTSTWEGLRLNNVIALVSTGVLAFGLFPPPPDSMRDLAHDHPIISWGLIWALMYQGQADRDGYMALAGTGIMYMLYKAADSQRGRRLTKSVDRFLRLRGL